MSDKLRKAFGLIPDDEPRVRTKEELQREYDDLDQEVEKMKKERTAMSKSINRKAKQMEGLKKLIEDNNQINMFPND